MPDHASGAYRRAAAAWLAAFGVEGPEGVTPEVPFAPATLKQALDGALALGRAAGRLPEALRVVAEGEARLRRLHERLGLRRADRESEGLPRVACVERATPLTLAGRWVPDLVAHAGGRAVLAEAGRPSPAVPFDALSAADPDIIVLASGGQADEARSHRQALEDHPGWPALRAVREGRVFTVAHPAFVQPGPGLFEAAERLAAVLHPASADEPEGLGRR